MKSSFSRPSPIRPQPSTLVTGLLAALLFLFSAHPAAAAADPHPPHWFKETGARLERELVAKYGEAQRARLQRGLRQVGEFWRAGDGDAATFEAFVRENFAGDPATLDAMFDRYERLLEKLDGHMTELRYELRRQTDLELGPVLPFDEIFSGYEPSAHLTEDFFRNKLAFVVLLNFPLTTLEQRLKEGADWSRRQWAEVRLAQRFSKRIPGEVNQAISEAQADAELYINEYKICMHHLLDERGERLFPPKLRLITHWNLRDEIKAQYRDRAERPGPPAHDPARHGADRRSDHSAGRHQQSARGLEPVQQRGAGLAGQRPGAARRSRAPDLQSPRSRTPATRAADHFPSLPKSRSLFADRSHADGAALRGGPPDERSSRAGHARAGARLAAVCRGGTA